MKISSCERQAGVAYTHSVAPAIDERNWVSTTTPNKQELEIARLDQHEPRPDASEPWI